MKKLQTVVVGMFQVNCHILLNHDQKQFTLIDAPGKSESLIQNYTTPVLEQTRAEYLVERAKHETDDYGYSDYSNYVLCGRLRTGSAV